MASEQVRLTASMCACFFEERKRERERVSNK